MSLASDLAAVFSGISVVVWPSLADQAAERPYIVWRRNGGDPMATMGGTGTRARPNIAVYCCAETFDAADALATDVRAALKNASGAIRCQSVGLPIDGYDPDTKLYTVAIEASIFHKPA